MANVKACGMVTTPEWGIRDSQQTVLNRNPPAWTTFIEHKGWTVIQSLMCAQGRNEKCTRITVEVELLCIESVVL